MIDSKHSFRLVKQEGDGHRRFRKHDFIKLVKSPVPKGKLRINLVVLSVFIVGVIAAFVNYPILYKEVSVSVNNFLDSADAPEFIEDLDKWGFLDETENIRLPEMSEDYSFEIKEEYSLGLDLQGGVRLVYDTDVSGVATEDKQEALNSLRDVVERRINFLGVREPSVHIQGSSLDSTRLVVELAGIDDPEKAVEEIGATPFLEFRQLREESDYIERMSQVLDIELVKENLGVATDEEAHNYFSRICQDAENPIDNIPIEQLKVIQIQTKTDPCFESTELTGRFLDRADVVVNPLGTSSAAGVVVALYFNEEGARIFERITRQNIGQPLAISIDGVVESAPSVNDVISGGEATISGRFTRAYAQNMVRNLNSGALSVPISLVSQNQIGATLGEESVNNGLKAGFYGLIAIFIFMILVYRLSGVVAVFSLIFYLLIFITMIKIMPITMTLSGIAGLILSIGMAVDANVLVFERLREELKKTDQNIIRAIDNAFLRTWTAVRDGNVSTIITSIILFLFTTSSVQGFALTLGLGVTISMFSAMIVTRYVLKWLAYTRLGRKKILWNRMIKI